MSINISITNEEKLANDFYYLAVRLKTSRNRYLLNELARDFYIAGRDGYDPEPIFKKLSEIIIRNCHEG